MDWDDEAQREAMRQARELQKRDPEAASHLIVTLQATQEEQEKKGNIVDRRPDGYDPIKLYDIVCKEYGWRPKDIDEMHYMTFFAMVRAMMDRHEEENAQLKSYN
jgi:hypothetical protein